MQQEPCKNNAIPALETIATAWNCAAINYAVVHGLGDYPTALGRDLDVLMQAEHVQTAIDMAGKIFHEHGFAVVLPSPVWGKRLIAVKNGAWESATELHTIPRLSWRNVLFTARPTVGRMHGPFKIDPWASFVKRVLIPLLADGTRRFREKPHDLSLEEGEHEAAAERLPFFCGRAAAQVVAAIVSGKDITLAEQALSRLRRSFIFGAAFNAPGSSIFLGARALRQKVIRPFVPCSPVVALVGPDGVGKSTLIKTLLEGPASVFTKGVVRHWRPGLLPRLGALVGAPEPRPDPGRLLPPRRTAGRFQGLRLGYYFFDFVLGHFLKDRVDSSLQRLVLYDRCALDMAVDPLRFGLSSPWGTRSLWRFSPKPDLVVLLYDHPELIHHRKPELAVEEIASQLQQWLRLAESGTVDAVIRVDAPPEEIARRLRDLIMEAFFLKNCQVSSAQIKEEDFEWLSSVLTCRGGGNC